MHMAFKMVVFMLDDTGPDASELLLMNLEVLIQITKADAIMTNHILVDSRQAEATLFEGNLFTEGIQQLRIDKHLMEVFGIRIVRIERTGID